MGAPEKATMRANLATQLVRLVFVESSDAYAATLSIRAAEFEMS